MKALVLALLVSAASVALCSADWTQWRGPNRDGQATGLLAPEAWPEQLTRVWQVDGVGAGYAGPLVSGDSVWLHSRIGDEEVVTRRRVGDGSVIWTSEYAAPYKMNGSAASHGMGPKSTPILFEGRLFTLGISGILSGFDAESGRVLWRKDFKDEFSATWPTFGTAMSPAIVHGRLIAHVGTDKDGALLAINPADGSVAWRWDEEGPGYVSPMLINIAGQEMLVSQSAQHSIGLDPETGETLWTLPFKTPYAQNIVTPVEHDGLILFSGTRAKTVAVRVSKQDDRWKAEEVWTTTNATMYMSSPVIVDGVVYGFTEKRSGNLFAMKPDTGEVLWQGPGRMGRNATLLVVGGNLLTLTSDAELIVTELGADQYEAIRSYDVADSETYGHPAPVGDNSLLIRDDHSLTLWSWE